MPAEELGNTPPAPRNLKPNPDMSRTRSEGEPSAARSVKGHSKDVSSVKKVLLIGLRNWFSTAGEDEIAPMIWDVCDAIDSGLSKQMKSGRSALVLARIRGIFAREQLKNEEGGSISAEQAAERLRLSRQEVLKRYRAGLVIGWRDGRLVRFPVWQFGKHGLLPGMQRVLEALRQTLRNDDWGRMLFFLANRGSLNGRRPLDLVREGKIAQALNYAIEHER